MVAPAVILRRFLHGTTSLALLVCVGCQAPSALMSDNGRPKDGVSEVDKAKWSDVLRPRPRVDKVDAPVWEVPDQEEDVASVQIAYANWMETSGNFEAAKDAYTSALKDSPRSIDALIGLARTQSRDGDADLARKTLKKAKEVAPNSVEVLAAFGQFELDGGNVDEAAQMLMRATEIDPKNKAARYSLAVARARQGRIPEARTLFIATVGEAEAHHNLGMLLKDTRPREAAAEFRAAVAKKPQLRASATELATLEKTFGGPQIIPAGHVEGDLTR